MKRFIKGKYYKKVIGKTGGDGGYFIGKSMGGEKLKIIVDTDTTINRYTIGEIYDMNGFFTNIKEVSKEEVKVEIL